MSYPKTWDEVPLIDLCLEPFANGITLTQQSMGHGAKLVNIVDLYESHIIDIRSLGRANASKQQLKKSELKKGDIVFVRSSVKREGAAMCAYFPGDKEPVVFGCFNIRFRPKPKLVDSKFLTLFLRSSEGRSRLLNVCQTATITNINQDNLGLVSVPLPPLAEQKRIAAIAQKADRLRRTRRYALELSGTYLQSVFLEMFGNFLKSDTKHLFKDVLEIPLSNGVFEKNENYGSGTPVIWVDNLYHTISIDISNLRRANLDEKAIKKHEVIVGDLLFTRSSLVREGIGQINIVPKLLDKVTFECHTIRARVKQRLVNPYYILGLYRSS